MERIITMLICVVSVLSGPTRVFAKPNQSSGDHLDSALIHINDNRPTANVISAWRQQDTSVVLTVSPGYQLWEVHTLVREAFETQVVEINHNEIWMHYAVLGNVLQTLSGIFLRSSPFRVAHGHFVGCVLLNERIAGVRAVPKAIFRNASRRPWRITSSGVGDVEIGKPLPTTLLTRMELTRDDLYAQGRFSSQGFLVIRLEHMNIEVTLLTDGRVLSIRPGVDVRTLHNAGIGSDIRSLQAVYDGVTLEAASEPYACSATSPDLPGVRFVFTDCEKACSGESRVRDVVWTRQQGHPI